MSLKGAGVAVGIYLLLMALIWLEPLNGTISFAAAMLFVVLTVPTQWLPVSGGPLLTIVTDLLYFSLLGLMIGALVFTLKTKHQLYFK